MEIVEAIRARKSIRAFLPQPVPKQVLAEVLEVATRSPSWSNTQPWEVVVIGGDIMAEVKAALIEAATSGVSPAADIPQVSFAEPYISRSRDLGNKLYQVLGISREDREKRQEWALQGLRFFDAPNGLVFYLDEELGPWSLFDLGLFSQSLMLAALTFDLGTCSMAAVVRYPQVLRRILAIPFWVNPVHRAPSRVQPTSHLSCLYFTLTVGFTLTIIGTSFYGNIAELRLAQQSPLKRNGAYLKEKRISHRLTTLSW